MTTETKTPEVQTPAAPAAPVLSASVLKNVRAFASAYVTSEIAQANDDKEFAEILKGQTYEERKATRDAFVTQATTDCYTAPEKLWERTLNRIDEYFDVGRPKATTAKAVSVAAKRAADKQAADVIAKAKLGKPVEQATPAELMNLATDAKLTTANKRALVDAAMKKEAAEKRDKEKAQNDLDRTLREEARGILNGLHSKELEKALAALRKFKK